MNRKPLRPRVVPLALAALATAAALAVAARPAAAGGELTLRINDVVGTPGGKVAVVVRTYAPRPVGQGQICVRSCFAGGIVSDQPGFSPARRSCFSALSGYMVFSSNGDAQSAAFPPQPGSPQLVVVDFESPTGSINDVDGPLAVFFFDLSDTLEPGRTASIEFDAANTFLFDENGAPIPLDLRGGLLAVRPEGSAVKVGVEGDRIAPGQTAAMGVETYEPIRFRRGRFAFRYDPAVLTGTPTVRMDSRYGLVTFTVSTLTPGLVLVDFESPDSSLNGVPGLLVSIAIRSSVATPVGTRSHIYLDRPMSWVETGNGEFPVLKLWDGFVEFE